jgi:hypothetical protein
MKLRIAKKVLGFEREYRLSTFLRADKRLRQAQRAAHPLYVVTVDSARIDLDAVKRIRDFVSTQIAGNDFRNPLVLDDGVRVSIERRRSMSRVRAPALRAS